MTPVPEPTESDDDRASTLSERRIILKNVHHRIGHGRLMQATRGSRLRLTRKQRDYLREGARELQRFFQDSHVWEAAAAEAEKAEADLDIPHLLPGFTMWTSSMAALSHGAWWLLMPGCGAAAMRTSVCDSLKCAFLERRPEYQRLADAIKEGHYPLMAEVLEKTERVRCMLALHVQDE
ncbi:MAG: hypothetical protein D8M59_11340 [Planctomycetes bacterium]|nr:hypothetical protein [Planctomycetota bacterium]NOG54053.1 hypothetical protein [Planctomycetota bacterium]